MARRTLGPWFGGALVAALAVACGRTTERPRESGGEGASSGAYTLPMGSAGVDQAGQAASGSQAAGGAAGDTGSPGAAGEVSRGGEAPVGVGGKLSGGAGAGGEPSVGCSDPLVFADPFVELAVREQGQLAAGPIRRAAAEQISTLLLVDERVTDLDGLGCLSNLEQLGIRYGDVTSLAPLRGLQRLRMLETSDVAISSLVGLEELPLEQLSIYHSEVEDLTPLSTVETLQSLTLHGCRARDLAPLSSLTEMARLSVNYCDVVDLGPLSPLTALEVLTVHHNSVTELSALAPLTSLRALSVSSNEVEALSPLSSLTELVYLSVSGNRVTDLGPLAHLPKLESLHADNNAVTSLAPLAVRFHGFAELSWNKIADFSPLLQFKDPLYTSLVLENQRDENLEWLVDCAAQAETLSLARAMAFETLSTDCP